MADAWQGKSSREAEGVRGVKREGWDQRDKETRSFRDEEQLGREERTRRQGDAEIRSDCEGSKLAERKVSQILPRFEDYQNVENDGSLIWISFPAVC